MDWTICKKLRERRDNEQGAIPSGQGGSVSICLVYPNSYFVGMSSLGFQTVYRLLNDLPGIVCERAFLPDSKDMRAYKDGRARICSLESERELASFDVIAFSISFEPDFINVPTILRLSAIQACATQRKERDPLILGGGAVFSLNAEPAIEFFDAVFAGEAEASIARLGQACLQSTQSGKSAALTALCAIPGVSSPLQQSLAVNDTCDTKMQTRVAHTEIVCDETEFGHMYLVEVGRGCGRGCRFCAAGFAFNPYRQYPFALLTPLIREGLRYRKTIGLVGAAVSDHPSIEELCAYIVSEGGVPSLASLRLDRLTPPFLDILAKAGYKTIAIAPEGSSQRMRDLVRKNVTQEQIIQAARDIAAAGILNIKLYFIIGLPGETDDDLVEMIEMVKLLQATVVDEARHHKRLGEITLSVNPFIPKPFTPLQYAGMAPMAVLKRRTAWLEKQVRLIANVRMKVEDLNGAYLQGLLSRGGRELVPLIVTLSQGTSLKAALKQCSIAIEEQVTQTFGPQEEFPWKSHGNAETERLQREYAKAMVYIEERS